MVGIYLITSPNNKFYIGQSKEVEKRFAFYRSGATKSQRRVLNSFNKYGVENHTFEVLHECAEDMLNAWESFYIKLFDTFGTDHGMNLRSGGDVSKVSEETRQRMCKAQAGKVITDQMRRKLSIANTGRVRPQKDKDKISATMKTRKKTPEHLENINKAMAESEPRKKMLLTMQANRQQIVLHLPTGVYFDSIKQGAAAFDLRPQYLTAILNGAIKTNKTGFIKA